MQIVFSRAYIVPGNQVYCFLLCATLLPCFRCRSKYYDGLSNPLLNKMKPFRIVSSSDITSSLSNKSDTPLEWSKCIFCQEDTGKKLVCPADYADRFRGAGYKTIAETLQAFYDLGCLPDDVNLTRMNDGDGLEQTFVSRRAKFHTTCSLKFNKNELQRATKRKTSADEEISPGAKKNILVKTSSEKMKPLIFVSFVTNLQQIQNHSIKPQHWTLTLECASVQ